MVRCCSVVGCDSVIKKKEDNKENNLSFFTFPLKNPNVLHQWIRAVSRENFVPTKHSLICSLHFRSCDFLVRPGTYRPQLKPDAVPSIFRTYPSYLQPKVVNKRRILQSRNEQETGLPLPTRPDHAYSSFSTQLLHAYNSNANGCSQSQQQQQQLQQSQSSSLREVNPVHLRWRKKVKLLQQQLRRKRNQVRDLKSLIKQLKTSGKIEPSDAAILDDNFSGMQLELFKNEQVNTKLQSPRYSTSIKEFALSLFYYSPRAYAFARQSLHLPHPSTVRSWSASVDCQPGFLSTVFQQLKLDAQRDVDLVDCALMFDSMSIRKQTVWDPSQNKYIGFVDYGVASVEPAEQLASEVLVILLVGLKKKWKCPVGYFLINKISSTVQSEIIRTALVMSAEAGLRVWTVTCDGAAVNIETLRLLGCKIGTTYEDLESSFEHPTQMYRCYAMLDVCHMLKLARNALADMSEFFLFYYSPRAYAFARQSLHLPHPSTVRSWSASVDCQPGFLSTVFQQLKLDAQRDVDLVDCALMFDSMSIRKQTVWDPSQNKYIGFVDYGVASVEYCC